MSEWVYIGVGATMASSVGTVFGSTVGHLKRVDKSVAELEARAKKAGEARQLEEGLERTARAARAANDRVARLGAELGRAKRPTRAMGDALARARREAEAANRTWREQRGRLAAARAEMRAAGDDADDLAAAQRRLTGELERQKRHRARVGDLMERRDQTRANRERLRGEMAEAAGMAWALTRAVGAAVRPAMALEETMADVGKTTGLGGAALRALGADALALSRTMPLAATEIGDIMAMAGAGGVKTRGALVEIAEAGVMLGVAFDMSGREAGDALMGLGNIFGLTLGKTKDLTGSMNHLSDNMHTTARDILTATRMSGGLAKDLGLSGESAAAFAATMLDAQVPAAEVGTTLRYLFTQLKSPEQMAKPAIRALESLGLSAGGLRDALKRDAEGALVDLFDRMAKGGDKGADALGAIAGTEHAGKLVFLKNNIDKLREAIRLARSEQAGWGSTTREYDTRSETTANQMVLLSNRATAAGIAIGEALLPPLADAAVALGSVADAVGSAAARFPGVTRAVTLGAGALVTLKVATVGARFAMSVFSETADTARLVMSRAGEAMVWYRRNATAATAATGAFNARLATTLRRVPLLGRVLPAAGAGFGVFGAGAVGATRGLRLFRAALIGTGVGALLVGVGMAIGLVVSHWDHLKSFFAGVGRGFGSMLDAMGPVGVAVRAIGRVFGKVFGWIGSLFEANAETIGDWGEAGETVGKALGKAFGYLAAPINNVVGAVAWVGGKLGLWGGDAPASVGATKTAAAVPKAAGPLPPSTAGAASRAGAGGQDGRAGGRADHHPRAARRRRGRHRPRRAARAGGQDAPRRGRGRHRRARLMAGDSAAYRFAAWAADAKTESDYEQVVEAAAAPPGGGAASANAPAASAPAMLTLGDVVFAADGAGHQRLRRVAEYRHPEIALVGARPARQWTGPRRRDDPDRRRDPSGLARRRGRRPRAARRRGGPGGAAPRRRRRPQHGAVGRAPRRRDAVGAVRRRPAAPDRVLARAGAGRSRRAVRPAGQRRRQRGRNGLGGLRGHRRVDRRRSGEPPRRDRGGRRRIGRGGGARRRDRRQGGPAGPRRRAGSRVLGPRGDGARRRPGRVADGRRRRADRPAGRDGGLPGGRRRRAGRRGVAAVRRGVRRPPAARREPGRRRAAPAGGPAGRTAGRGAGAPHRGHRATVDLTPDYSVRAGGDEISGRLKSALAELVVVRGTDRASDSVEITLGDAAGDVAAPPTGRELSVWMGYAESDLVDMGTYWHSETDLEFAPARRLVIRATGADLRAGSALKAPRTRAWRDTTVGGIVQQIAADHGYSANVDAAIGATEVSDEAQTAESDLHFLRRLARRYDGTARAVGQRLVLARAGTGASVSGQSMPALTVSPSAPPISGRVAYRERPRYGAVRASWLDTAGGAPATGDRRRRRPDDGPAGPLPHPRRSRRRRGSETQTAGADSRDSGAHAARHPDPRWRRHRRHSRLGRPRRRPLDDHARHAPRHAHRGLHHRGRRYGAERNLTCSPRASA